MSLLFVAIAATHCGAPPADARSPASTTTASLAERPAFFSSKRFSVRIPFEGNRWRIDDHSAPYLMATREGSAGREVLKLASFYALTPLSHDGCRELGYANGVFELSSDALQTLFEPVSTESIFLPLDPHARTSTLTPEGFRTKVGVWVKKPKREAPDAVLEARLQAVGTDNRKCFVFEYRVPTTAIKSKSAGERLGAVRTTVLEHLDWRTQEDVLVRAKH
ncbi:MAG: hypothetical protein KBF88_16680 [Polyangiaceae bacterium]|nr:hypothetical protein [Polyangiaceae bacterium]